MHLQGDTGSKGATGPAGTKGEKGETVWELYIYICTIYEETTTKG